MSKAFEYVPDVILSESRPHVGVVVKSYDDMRSFRPRKRIFASLFEANEAMCYLNPEADKIVAMYATADQPGGWSSIQTMQNWPQATHRTLMDLED